MGGPEKPLTINRLAKEALSEIASSPAGSHTPTHILESVSKLVEDHRRPAYIEEYPDEIRNLLITAGKGPVLVLSFAGGKIKKTFACLNPADNTHNREGSTGVITNSLNESLEDLY